MGLLLLRPTLVADGDRTCDILHMEDTAVVKHSFTDRFLHKAFECACCHGRQLSIKIANNQYKIYQDFHSLDKFCIGSRSIGSVLY